jgi:hypothetical protein
MGMAAEYFMAPIRGFNELVIAPPRLFSPVVHIRAPMQGVFVCLSVCYTKL